MNVVNALFKSLADFLFVFQEKVKMWIKVSNNYRCAIIYIDAYINALKYKCIPNNS